MVREYKPEELVTDTAVEFREHSAHSKAKRVVTVDPDFYLDDPNSPTRNLKPVNVTVGAASVDGFDLVHNAVYRFISPVEMNIALAVESGTTTPDGSDFLVPPNTPVIIRTDKLWKRLEVYSTAGGKAQLARLR